MFEGPDDHFCPLVKDCVLVLFFAVKRQIGGADFLPFSSRCRTDVNLLVEDIEFVSSYAGEHTLICDVQRSGVGVGVGREEGGDEEEEEEEEARGTEVWCPAEVICLGS